MTRRSDSWTCTASEDMPAPVDRRLGRRVCAARGTARPESLARRPRRPSRSERIPPGLLRIGQFIDEQIGRILATLKKRGLLRQHADRLLRRPRRHARRPPPLAQDLRLRKLGQHPHARALAQEHGPGPAAGKTLPQPAELRDVLPTFLDAAGAPIPSHLDGRSLLELVRGEHKRLAALHRPGALDVLRPGPLDRPDRRPDQVHLLRLRRPGAALRPGERPGRIAQSGRRSGPRTDAEGMATAHDPAPLRARRGIRLRRQAGHPQEALLYSPNYPKTT